MPLFVKNGIEYIKRDNWSIFNNTTESLVIEFTNMKSSHGKAIVDDVIYRSPHYYVN